MAKNSPQVSEPKPRYIRKRVMSDESVQLTCRIPVAAKQRIDRAIALLRDHGEDMQLVDIVLAALEEAADYVERHYHEVRRTTDAPSTASSAGVVSAQS